MQKIIKNILEKLEKEGYEAYIVGGYIRDLLMGISSYDIDICTNAKPRELLNIFPSASSKNLGGIEFKIKEFYFEITTYREEIKYKNRKPIEYNYVDNLVTDLKRRDFTINALCMNSKGEIIDLTNGIEDLTNLKIKMIGDIETKIIEDPLRILRAIRIATILNFSLDSNLYKEILKNKDIVLTLSNTRIKEELDKILLSNNVKKGLNLLEELGILNLLNIENNSNIIPIKNLEGMYAQLNINYNLPFTKEEKNNIAIIKKIIADKGINNNTLYYYGLFLCQVAAEILNIDKITINKMYKNLPIHNRKDINLKADDIAKALHIDYSKTISIIYKDIELKIINGEIKNKKNYLIKYITDNKGKWL